MDERTGATAKADKSMEPLTNAPVSEAFENALVVEYLQRMPSILARALAYLCLLLLVVATAYVIFCSVDVIVTCQAVAWPEARKVRVISDRSGIVDSIYVAEGSEVQKGEKLFLVRSKEVVSHRARVDELDRLIPLKTEFYDTKLQSLNTELKHLDAEYGNQIDVKRLKLDQNKISVAQVEAEILYYRKEKANLTTEFENTRKLFEKRLTSLNEFNYFKGRMEKARTELDKQEAQKRFTLKEKDIIEKDIQNLNEVYGKKKTVLAHEIENLKVEGEVALQSLRSELEKTKKMLDLRVDGSIPSPGYTGQDQVIQAAYAGKISELHVRNVGDYVRDSDVLCTIVPSDSPLYMDVTVENKDIGFIQTGLRIKYKFDAFPFSDYGMREGTVLSTAPSAVEEGSRRFVYHVQGGIDKSWFEDRGKTYPIKAGMTAKAEIVTERKSLLSLLLRTVKN